MMTWVRRYSRVTAQRDYRLTHAATGAVVARATTTWAYVDRERQTPKRIPAAILERIPIVNRVAAREPAEFGAAPEAPPPLAVTSFRARSYEADVLRHVNNCVYADWLSEAASLALDEWAARLPATVWLPRRLNLRYLRSARPGDAVAVTTTLERVGSRGVALRHLLALSADPSAELLRSSAILLAAPALAR